MSDSGDIQGEKRYATILFADVMGSTRLVHGDDPERVVELILPAVDRMAESVAQFGGVVASKMGDGLMAIFGAPTALVRHEVQACHAALEMQRLHEEARRSAQSSGSPGFRIRVGIHSGEVIIQGLHKGLSTPFDAFGFTTHLASRMEGLAEPGGILISATTYRAVARAFDCEPLGAKSVKGVPERVEVFALRRPRHRDRSTHDDRSSVALDGQFVGRKAELAQLSTILKGLAGGRGAIAAVLGPAGIGKSRLLDILESRNTPPGLLWLKERNVSATRNLPYWLLIRVMMTYFEFSDAHGAEERWRRLESVHMELFGEKSRDVLPFIATFMGVPVLGPLAERVVHLNGEDLRNQVFRAVRRLFRRITEQRATVLVLDDIYFADSASVELVAHLFQLVNESRLLICFICREGTEGVEARLLDIARDRYVESLNVIQLQPLGVAESEALIEGLPGGKTSSPRLRKRILGLTEGNPLFLKEVVHSLVTVASDGDGSSEARSQIDEDRSLPVLPKTIKESILVRVDRLPPDALNVMRIAAVIGRPFDIQTLSRLVEPDLQVEKQVDLLLRQDLFLSEASDDRSGLFISHTLTQEAVYDSILNRDKRRLHEAVARLIETEATDQIDAQAGVLAYHYTRAENWEKAREHIFKAGDEADRIAGNSEALAYFGQAADVLAQISGIDWSPGEQARIDSRIGAAYYRRREYVDALRHIRRALQLYGVVMPTRRHRIRLDLLRFVISEATRSFLPIPSKRHWNEAGSDDVARALEVMKMLWWVYLFEDQERMFLVTLIAMRLSRRHARVAEFAWASATTVFTFDVLGNHQIAGRIVRRTREIAVSGKHPVAVAYSYLCSAWHQCYIGRWEDSKLEFTRSNDLTWKIGLLNPWLSGVFGLTFIRILQGRFEECGAEVLDLLEIGRDVDDPAVQRTGELLQAMIDNRTSDFSSLGDAVSSADPTLTKVYEAAKADNDQLFGCLSGSDLLNILISRGQLDAAASLVQDLQATIVEKNLRGHHVALCKLQFGRFHVARLGLDMGHGTAEAERACHDALRAGRHFRGVLPAALRLSGRLAWLTRREAKARRDWKRSILLARSLPSALDEVMTLFEVARSTGSDESEAVGWTRAKELGVAVPSHRVL